jgi:hypothetical protein
MNIQEEVHESELNKSRKRKTGDKKSSNGGNNSSLIEVRKCAYCDIHTPLEVLSPSTRKKVMGGLRGMGSGLVNTLECEEAMKQAQKMRMKRARKILAERRNAPPQICLPTIPVDRVQTIYALVDHVQAKEKLVEKLMNYWLMKR